MSGYDGLGMSQLPAIFLTILLPVYALILLGYLVAAPLGLEARTLSRVAYYVLVPAFVINVVSGERLDATLASRMALFISVVHLGMVLLAGILARALSRGKQVTAAYMLVAVFGNVGNFGLPIIQFAYGDAAQAPATIYFLVIVTISFAIGVAVAGWQRGGGAFAAVTVLRTPALLAVPPALALNALQLPLPLPLARPIGLLAGAMVPTMLLALGIQLASTHIRMLDADIAFASGVKLLGGPLLALALAGPFALQGVERGAGVFQAATPVAVFASIIALENDLLPEFVTATVLVSTIAGTLTMAVVLALV